MQNMPFISIIIPAYNVEKYIARCLDSTINQTLANIEIIVVDDCGSDKSIDIAKDYAKRDCRIKIIHNPRNLGLFWTRISGEKKARGEYILALDSDDYLENITCKTLYKAILSISGALKEVDLFANPNYAGSKNLAIAKEDSKICDEKTSNSEVSCKLPQRDSANERYINICPSEANEAILKKSLNTKFANRGGGNEYVA